MPIIKSRNGIDIIVDDVEMELMQKIKQISVGLSSILGIVVMHWLIANAELLSAEAYLALAVGLVVVIATSIISHVYKKIKLN